MANRIVVMNDGMIQQVGAPLELYDCPANIFVAGFIGSPTMNFIEGTVTLKDGPGVRLADGTIIGIPAGLHATEGQEVTIGMRPEHLQLSGVGIAGEVMVVEPLGMNTQVTLTVMGDRLTLMAMDRPKIAPGDPVKLAIVPSNVHVFSKLTGQRIG